MDEKELNKKLRSEVKPGTESIALNEAQTQANQLLTEQRMNLESEKQISSMNLVRDTELRGAIELGAMSSGSQPSPQRALPPQSAGLRPETQELLSRYGINPQITESSRSNSSSTQSRSSTINRQSNRVTESRVTNTTNITNITNNNTKTETDIDVSNPQQRVTQPTVAQYSTDNTNKFKIYMDNLFSKRDQERRNQEKEFRKRDWSIKRMTDKVMGRMEKISDSFSKKMNPENLGKTFGSQMKLLLGAVGLTLLPKLWPKIISGIDTIGEWMSDIKDSFNGTNGGFFEKVGNAVGTGVSSLAGGLIGAVESIADRLSIKLGEILGGKDYKDSGKGVFQVAAEKLASFLANKDIKFDEGSDWKGQFGESLKEYLSQVKDDLKSMLDLMMEDRSEAVKSAASKMSFSDVFKPKELVTKLADIIGAAVGGSRYLTNASLSAAEKQSSKDLFKGADSEDKSFFGNIKTEHGASIVARNISKASLDQDVSNSVTITEGLKKLYKFGTKSDGNGFTIRESEVKNIASRVGKSDADINRIISEVNSAINSGWIKAIQDETYTKTGDFLLRVPKNSVPTFIALLNGMPVSFRSEDIEKNNSMISRLYKDKDLYRSHQESLDKMITSSKLSDSVDWGKAFNPLHWGNELGKFFYNSGSFGGRLYTPVSYDFDLWKTKDEKSSFRQFGYYKNKEKLDEYNRMMSEAKNRLKNDSGIGKIDIDVPKLPSMPSIDTDNMRDSYSRSRESSKAAVNKAIDNIPSVGQMMDSASNFTKSSISKIGDTVNYALYEADFDKGYVREDRKGSRQVTDKSIEGNNPGNIRGSGPRGFAVYRSLSDGYAALFNKLRNWFREAPDTERSRQLRTEDGKPVAGNPADSINKFIRIWAPNQDGNNEESYVSFLENYTGIPRDKRIDINDADSLKAIAEGITIMEHLGGKYPSQRMLSSIDEGWRKSGTRINPIEYSSDSSYSPLSSDSYSSSNSMIQSGVEGIWSSLVSELDSLFGSDGQSDNINKSIPEISKYESGNYEYGSNAEYTSLSSDNTSIAKFSAPKLDYESVDKYIEDKESELSKEESGMNVASVNTGGNTSINNSGNTTVVNYNINDPKDSFLELKSRNYRRT